MLRIHEFRQRRGMHYIHDPGRGRGGRMAGFPPQREIGDKGRSVQDNGGEGAIIDDPPDAHK